MRTSTRALLYATALASAIAVNACGGGAVDDGTFTDDDDALPDADDGGDITEDAGDVLPPDSGEPDFANACPATTCAASTATTATALTTLVDAIPAANWAGASEYETGCLPISDDLTITADLTLSGADLAIPAWCASGTCRQEVFFNVDYAPEGVECNDLDTSTQHRFCGSIKIHGPATFRVRATRIDTFPSSLGSVTAVVQIVKGCGATCDATEFADPLTHTCWNTPRNLCAFSLGGTNAQCGCFDGTHVEPNGTTCAIRVSGDNGFTGTCDSGECTPD